ncbi:MAG: hypothetical protein SF172_04485 [Burkholderiales bacterium]|nr:hypothetical protein [Betaproteobacteria bacterium]MDX2218259.1 hypothetical protein [Burkholderiales bacterium]
MKFVSMLFAAVLATASFATLAAGKHEHGDSHKPKHGGVVQEVKEIAYELVAKADSLTIYVDDHGKDVDTKGATAKVTLLNGAEKTEATLSPAGGNKLEAKGSFKVEKGTKAVAVVTLAGKPAQSIRFNLK